MLTNALVVSQVT